MLFLTKNHFVVESYKALCLLMLMRLKTELDPFDKLRLHKAAIMLEVFSSRNCFNISDSYSVYYQVVNQFSEEIRNFQTQCNTNTPQALEKLLSTVDPKVDESYKRSTPYLLQSAEFVNSISDNTTLTTVSALIGIIRNCDHSTINTIAPILKNSGYSISNKDILTSLINLEKSGVIIKEDEGYQLSRNYKGVGRYIKLM